MEFQKLNALDEDDSIKNPITSYAKSKSTEIELKKLKCDNFHMLYLDLQQYMAQVLE